MPIEHHECPYCTRPFASQLLLATHLFGCVVEYQKKLDAEWNAQRARTAKPTPFEAMTPEQRVVYLLRKLDAAQKDRDDARAALLRVVDAYRDASNGKPSNFYNTMSEALCDPMVVAEIEVARRRA